jgi:PAS domain S-box-containing protein
VGAIKIIAGRKIAALLKGEGQNRFHRAMVAVGLIAAIASAALMGLVLWEIRSDQIDAGRQINESLTLAIDEQTTNTFKAADLALTLGKNLLLQARSAGTLDVERARALLRSVLVDRAIIRAIWILNESGRIVYDSDEGNIGIDLSDRPYFRFHRDNPERPLHIGDPVLSRSVGTWFISLSQPLRSPDGSFEGVIVTAIETLYFKRIWDRIDLGPNSTIALIRRDGTLVIRSPVNPELYGQRFPSPTFVQLSAIAPTGSYPTVSPVDGVKRYLSYSVLSYYPELALLVGRSQDVILAAWWRFAYVAAVGWIVAVALIGALLYWLQGARRLDLKNQEEAGKILREAEATLRETEARLRVMADHSPLAISLTDAEGRYLFVNKCFCDWQGLRPEDALGKTGAEVFPGRPLEHMYARRREAMKTGQPVWHTQRVTLQDGTVHDFEFVNFPLPGPAPTICTMASDVTDQRKTEEQLRQAQKMEAVGQLTGGIAHDFNNLLTVVLGNAEILAESLTDNPRLHHLAELMSRAAQHGATLTNGLLAFARKQTLQPKVTDINQLVRRLDGLLRRSLGEHIEIRLSLADSLGHATVDPTQLEVAILNLAVNARDAMPDGGKLAVETANADLNAHDTQPGDGVAPGPYVSISVTDTGTGMSRETLTKVFDPFFTTKELGKGTGLGLSMVYGFVKQSNGHVKIHSEIGRGTTVRLYLPRSTETAEQISIPSAPAEISRGSETILVVEDDDMVRSYVQSQLAALGYNVLIAHDGQEALDILRGTTPVDLLFTDIVMPGGLNGAELVADALRLRPTLKSVYTSGYAESLVSSHRPPGDDVALLQKPYMLRDLAAILRKVLDARPAPS